MKNTYPVIVKAIISALFLSVIFISCQKEYYPFVLKKTPYRATAGSFTAKINNVKWTASKSVSAVMTTGGNGVPGQISISALSYDNKTINITLIDSGVYKYTIGNDSTKIGVYIDRTFSGTYVFTTDQAPYGIAGTVDITAINTNTETVSGTFSFRARRKTDNKEVNITEGSFTDIPY